MTSQSPADRVNRASNEILDATSFLNGTNAAFIEQLYAQYQENPDAVDPSWRQWFAELRENAPNAPQVGRGPEWRRDAKSDFARSEEIGALTGQWPARKTAGVSEADLHDAAHKSI